MYLISLLIPSVMLAAMSLATPARLPQSRQAPAKACGAITKFKSDTTSAQNNFEALLKSSPGVISTSTSTSLLNQFSSIAQDLDKIGTALSCASPPAEKRHSSISRESAKPLHRRATPPAVCELANDVVDEVNDFPTQVSLQLDTILGRNPVSDGLSMMVADASALVDDLDGCS